MAPPFDVELHLQQHGTALRRLAFELLGDAADADDAMQETWLRAMRRPPRDTSGIGGWLATILTNVVRRTRRGEGRRVRRESAAAKDGVAEDASAVMAREETVRRLLDAVTRLEQPYRDAIWQRWLEGRPPREIAAANGEPLATVKSRLRCGLEKLREKLGKDGRGEWRAAFLSAFGFGKENAAATTFAGGALMAMWTTTAAVAALLLATGAWFVWPESGTDGTSVIASGDARVEPAADVVAAAGAAVAQSPTPARELDFEREPATAARSALATVSGRCIDESGVPLAGCEVSLAGRVDVTRAAAAPRAAALQWTGPASVPTGNDGAFVFEFAPPPGFSFDLRAAHDGAVPRLLREMSFETGRRFDVGDVMLQWGVAVRGLVVDRRGNPVSCVQIDLKAGDAGDGPREGRHRAAATDDDGRFVFDGRLLPGSYEPRVNAGCEVVEPVRIELSLARPDEEVRVVIDVPVGIRGRVVDDAGAPLSAALWIEPMLHDGTRPAAPVRSRRDGAFFLPKPVNAPDGPVTVTVGAVGHERLASEPIEWGTSNVELRVRRTRGLVVRVVDRDGTPATDFDVRCAPMRGPTGRGVTVDGPVGPFPDGTATLPNVSSGRWLVCVDFPSTPSLAFREVVDVPEAGGRVVFTRDGVSARVRVVDTDGRPMPGSEVQWCELFGKTFAERRIVLSERIWRLNASTGYGVIVAAGHADANGEFVARLPRGRSFGLRALGPGHVTWSRDSVVAQEEEVVATVERGARLVGRLLPGNGLDALRRYEQHAPTSHRGDFRSDPPGVRQLPIAGAESREDRNNLRPLTVTADGAFVVAGLATGTWRLEFEFPVVVGFGGAWSGGRDHLDLGIVTLVAGADVSLDIDTGPVLPGEIDARVLHNGAPFTGSCELFGPLAADDGTATSMIGGRTDANGGLRAMLRPGRYRVAMTQRREDHTVTREIRAPETALVVSSTTVRATFTFTSGTLVVTVLDANGDPVRKAIVRCRVGEQWSEMPATDLAGRATAEVGPGRAALRVAFANERGELGDGVDGIDVGEITIAAAATTEHTIRLPTARAK